MSFSKKVDNIIYDLKDINKMYFSLQNKNLRLFTKIKNGVCNGVCNGSGNIIDTSDIPAAGISSRYTNSSHNQWTTSLRRL